MPPKPGGKGGSWRDAVPPNLPLESDRLTPVHELFEAHPGWLHVAFLRSWNPKSEPRRARNIGAARRAGEVGHIQARASQRRQLAAAAPTREYLAGVEQLA